MQQIKQNSDTELLLSSLKKLTVEFTVNFSHNSSFSAEINNKIKFLKSLIQLKNNVTVSSKLNLTLN